MFVFWNPCPRAELHQRKRARKLCSATLNKAGTHEGACSRSTLLQHTPGAKLPRLHQRFLAKKYVGQQNFCSRVLLPHIKLVWYEGARSRDKSVAHRILFQEQAPSCVLKFALRKRVSGASSLLCTGWDTYPGACFGSVFQEQAPSCVLVGVLTAGFSAGISLGFPGACFGSVFQEQAPSCVPALSKVRAFSIENKNINTIFLFALNIMHKISFPDMFSVSSS